MNFTNIILAVMLFITGCTAGFYAGKDAARTEISGGAPLGLLGAPLQ
jgi:hypothetical protein